MSEPTKTDVDGNVHGPVQSGAFSGPVQTVHVSIPVATEIPPELQNATLRQIQLGLITAIQNLEDRVYHWRKDEAAERIARQHDTDGHRVAMTNRIDRIDHAVQRMLVNVRWLRGLSVGLVLIDLMLIAEVGFRLGWW